MNAALYVRVSTQEQALHGLSVDDQIQALKKYCAENGLTVYKIYNDAGISGHTTYLKRPKLLELIADCKAKNVDVILFTRIDRWFRSVKDYYLVTEQLGGVPWKAIWEDYETETSAGQFKVNIMLSISEAEAARTSEKVRSVLQYKKAKGEYLGKAPWGFKVENRKLVVDTEAEPLVRLMFETYLRTSSSFEAQKALINAGFKCPANTLRNRLKNPQYIGAYITEEEHNRIVDGMAKYVRHAKENVVYIFTGIVFCGYCGCRMAATHIVDRRAKSGKVVHYNQYRCTKHEHGQSVFVTEKVLEKQLLEMIEPAFNKARLEKIETRKDELPKADPAKLRAKLKRIGIRFEDGDITVEEYRQKRNDILRQLREIETSNEEPISLPDNWRSIYDCLDNLGKRAFWRSFISEIRITKENRYSLGYDDLRYTL